MIRLTFSPEFPRRTVEVEEISEDDRGRIFGDATVFSHSRGGYIGGVVGGHYSGRTKSWVRKLRMIHAECSPRF